MITKLLDITALLQFIIDFVIESHMIFYEGLLYIYQIAWFSFHSSMVRRFSLGLPYFSYISAFNRKLTC